jgi:predicted CopG family antitoxin
MQIYTTRETEDKLRQLAEQQGKSMSEVIRELVNKAKAAK